MENNTAFPRQQPGFLWLLAQSLLVAIAFYFCFRWMAEVSQMSIFQVRDLERADRLAAGQLIFFGPEMTGGGQLPGSFYYFLLAIPATLGLGIAGAWNLMLLLAACTAGLTWAFLYRACGLFSAILATACLFTSTSISRGMWSFLNPSFSFLWILLSLVGLCGVFGRPEKRFYLWLATCLAIALGIQLHFTLAMFLLAAVILQIFSRRLGVYGLKWKHFFSGILLISLCQLPYLAWLFSNPATKKHFQSALPGVGNFSGAPRTIIDFSSSSLQIIANSFFEHPRYLLGRLGHSFPDPLVISLLGIVLVGRYISPASSQANPFQHRCRKILWVCVGITIFPLLITASPVNFQRYGHCFFFASVLLLGFLFTPLPDQKSARGLLEGTLLFALIIGISLSWHRSYPQLGIWWASGFILIILLVSVRNIRELMSLRLAGVILFPLYIALQQPLRPAPFKSYQLSIAESRNAASAIIANTGWNFEKAKDRIYWVNLDNEASLRYVYNKEYLKGSPAVSALSLFDGFFLASLPPHHAQSIPGDWKQWLIEQDLEPTVANGLQMDTLKIKSPIAVGSSVFLLPYTVERPDQLPRFFQNHGDPYVDNAASLNETLADALGRSSDTAAVALFNNCPGKEIFCRFAIVARSKNFRNARELINVRILGESLAQASPWISPAWNQSIRSPYIDFTCANNTKVRVALAESVGYRIPKWNTRPASSDEFNFRYLQNRTFLSPLERDIFPGCQAVTKMEIGYASSTVISGGKVLLELPGDSRSFGILRKGETPL